HSFYLNKASRGHADVMVLLASNFQFGRGAVASLSKASYWYRQAALQRQPYGQLATAILLLEMDSSGKNSSEARRWLIESAEQGVEEAALILNHLQASLGQGETVRGKELAKGLEKQFQKGKEFIELDNPLLTPRGLGLLMDAARHGHAEATYYLGQIYFEGKRLPPNPRRAIVFWESLAKEGHGASLYTLSRIYRGGVVVKQDLPRANQYLSLAAKKGHKEAQLLLGAAYLRGAMNYPQDPKKAIEYLRKAAEKGSFQSQAQLGILLLKDQQYEEALKWLTSAAGHGNPSAQYLCGTAYFTGLGTRPDPKEAAYWFANAAYQGHIESQFQLGSLYFHGEGLPKDPAQAFQWTLLAAQKGHLKAQLNLGVMYARGYGVPRNNINAIKWYRKAAVEGFKDAQVLLAMAYYHGEGIERDYDHALVWFSKAAEQGDTQIQDLLARLYSGEKEVPIDFTRAYAWRSVLHTSRGDQDEVLKELGFQLDEQELKKAQELSLNIWAKIHRNQKTAQFKEPKASRQ
ncbi:sel1 repeat family protein, partial [bacterium]|nr:sel1 repeat family protein [bacterium]